MSTCTESKLGRLLHTYELNLLSAAEEERFELHLMECEHCFKLAKRFRLESVLLTHDDEVARKIGELASASALRSVSVSDSTKTASDSLLTRFWRHLWPDSPLAFRPALLYALLLVLIIPAFRGLKPAPEQSPELIRPVRAISLFPLRDREEPVLYGMGEGEGLISCLFPGAVAGADYRLLIETEDGAIVFRDDRFTGFDEEETGRLIIPLAGLEPGRYRLTVTDPRRKAPYNTEEYFFHLAEAIHPAE